MNNKLESEQHVNPFQRFDRIVKILRSEDGCPWDQKQTAKSLKKYLLEETAELAEAIEQGNPQHICEETGDLYFILSLLTAIFEEQGIFPHMRHYTQPAKKWCAGIPMCLRPTASRKKS